MTVFHFFNCAILTFGPHVVFYFTTPLSEYDTLRTSIKAAVVYLATTLVKLLFSRFRRMIGLIRIRYVPELLICIYHSWRDTR
ncbi:hypothetical protein D0Y65_015747 [Glycine soja]|uniref:BOS complex subunit TMEM147 n=1 Tax=Glycine soja TaxID=3848 RepID=A0A445KE65_GLYSO|nr:hypothetical protein D0Y65_015747 [Glycine soja]